MGKLSHLKVKNSIFAHYLCQKEEKQKHNIMAFFKTNKPRSFEYKPRFYDPKKEELEQLKAKYGSGQGESYSRRINFRKAFEEKKKEKMSKRFPIGKILLFATLAIVLLYVLLTIVEHWK